MPISEQAISDVVEILLHMPITQGDFLDTVSNAGYNYNNIVTTISTFPKQIREVFQKASSDGWLDEFCLQVEIKWPANTTLCDKLNELRQSTGAIQDGWYNTPGEATRSLLANGQAIADREVLRNHINRMSEATPRRLLLLRGDSETGKTHSKEMFEFVARRRGERIASVDLNYWDDGHGNTAGGATIELVSESLERQLAIAPPQLPPNAEYTSEARKAEEWARRLADTVKTKFDARPTWIFIDHLDTSTAKPEVNKFIQKLAFLAEREKYELRIVVAVRNMERNAAFGTIVGSRSLQEEVKRVEDSDLDAFFGELCHQIRGVDLAPGEAEAARKAVRERAGDDPYELPRAIVQVAKEKFTS